MQMGALLREELHSQTWRAQARSRRRWPAHRRGIRLAQSGRETILLMDLFEWLFWEFCLLVLSAGGESRTLLSGWDQPHSHEPLFR